MKVLFASLTVLAVLPIFAIDAVWNKPTAATQNWRTAGNWKDAATGQAASAAPQYAGDTATFPDPLASGVEQQVVSTGPSNYVGPGGDGVDPDIQAVTGTFRHVILHASTRPSDGMPTREFSVVDPNGFLGYWTVGFPYAKFILSATEDFSSTLSSLSIANLPVVAVTNAAATARLGTVYAGGLLNKQGAGSLLVGATTGSDATFIVKDGDISFEGSAATIEALLARAATGSVVANAREIFAAGDWTTTPPYALSDETVTFGETTLDGEPVGGSACKSSALTGYHFTAVALPAGVTVTRTAQAQGETLVFTETLTRAERQVVNTYLRSRWGARAAVDAGTVFLYEASHAIGVESGGTARVGEAVLLSGSEIEKRGEGILELTRTEPKDAPVTVTAGGVGVTDVTPKGDTSKPAADPWLWLDANKTNTMTFSGTDITAWKDCRPEVSVTATYSSDYATAAPHLTTDPSLSGEAQGGTNVVEFVRGQACLLLPNWNQAEAKSYAVFFAARAQGSYPQWGNPVIGSSNSKFARSSSTYDLNYINHYAGNFALTGRWTANGKPVDPTADQVAAKTGFFYDWSTYYVISFSSDTPFRTDSILRSGTGAATTGNCGGMIIGEYLIYNRELTPAEKRDTEAYLLRKWVRTTKDHPADAFPRVASATFPAANPVLLSSSATGAVATVTGGDGTLVKKGKGVLYVSHPLTNTTSVTVDAGELRASFGFDDSLFHLDASDTDSLYTEIADGDGGAKTTNVVRWADVRRSGAYAYYRYRARYGDYAENDCVDHPPTYQAAETADGLSRPVIDFGTQYNSAASTCASGLRLDRDYSNVREAIVYGRTSHDIAEKPVWLFGANGGSEVKYSNWACSDWTIFGSGSPEQIRNGYFAIDGEETVPTSAKYLQQFACYDAGPTADTFINAIAIQRYYNASAKNGNAGGWRICEEMAFARNLTAAERAYMAAKLAYKWRGVGTKPVWTNETPIASISVAKGATFTDREAVHLTVASLSGGGTVNCGELAGVSSLTLDGASALTVNGKLILADAGTVTVDSSSAAKGVKFPLLTATELEAASLSKWTATGTGGAKVKLSVEGNTLYGLVRSRSGVVFVIR